MTCHALQERIRGCLLGAASGDALGGPVEGLEPAEIAKRHGLVDRMLPYPATIPPSFHGPFESRAGEYTDDTRLAKLICAGLIPSGGLPKAGDIHRAICAAYFNAESVLQRGFTEEYALKALYGQGKEVFGGKATNGAIMAIAPVGVLFPGDPWRTFDAAFEILSMATGSARISAAAAAACISVALAETGTGSGAGTGRAMGVALRGLDAAAERIRRTEASYWHYGRLYPRVGSWVFDLARKAIGIAWEYKDPLSEDFRKRLRMEIGQPFFADGDETLAIALAMFVAADGEFRSSVVGAVQYGKDCDSYATVAGALAGAYNGIQVIPEDWIEAVEACEASPRLRHLADGLCATVTTRMRREGKAAALVHFPGKAPTPAPAPKSGLLDAVRGKESQTVLRLLDEGADPEESGEKGRNCLHVACAGGSLEIVKALLVFGADINAKDDNRTTALHFAAWENHVEIVDLLLDWGIFPEETEGSGWTALHDSVRKEFADIPVHILSRSRGLRNEADRILSLQALHAEERFLALLGILAEFHVELGAIGICGHGFLHDARTRNYSRAAEYLRGKGVADEA